MANPSRGDVEIMLGENTYIIRPTFQLIRELETALGSLFAIGKRMQLNDLSVNEMVQFLWICIRQDPAYRKLKLNEIGDLVMLEGPVNLFQPISQFLINAINPGKEVDVAKGETEKLN